MPSQLTVTGTNGAGITVTALVLTDITSFEVNTKTKMLTVVQDSVTLQFAISAATTFTVTILAGNYTIVIS